MHRAKRTALIIGASSPGGLGEAAARRLHADGYDLVLAGRRMAPLQALAAELDAEALSCDVTDEEAVAAALSAAGAIDVLVNAAGTTDAGSIARIERIRVDAQMALHYTANVLLLKYAAAHMAEGGAVILFSSVTGQVPGAGLSAYSCAKAALEHLVRIAALEFGPRGIRVNAVAPGFASTPMTAGLFADANVIDLYLREVPLQQRATPPEAVAAAVAWLAAPDCFTTGETIPVSGGASLGRLPRAHELKAARRA